MSADICCSTVALGGVPVMRSNRRFACSFGPAKAGSNGCNAADSVSSAASVLRPTEVFEVSNIALRSVSPYRVQLGVHDRHEMVPGVMSRRNDDHYHYVNSAMLLAMKRSDMSPFVTPNTTHRTVLRGARLV